jgi:hypothetical protein
MTKEIPLVRLGVVGETVVKLRLLLLGYEVYVGDDNTSVDLIALNPVLGTPLKIEVKTVKIRRNSSNTGYKVDLRKGYSEEPLRTSRVDFVAIYVEPKNVVVFLPSTLVDGKTSFTLKDKDIEKYVDQYSVPVV